MSNIKVELVMLRYRILINSALTGCYIGALSLYCPAPSFLPSWLLRSILGKIQETIR